MPDYNLNNIISNTGDNLIEIGFDVEGYDVDNILRAGRIRHKYDGKWHHHRVAGRFY